MAKIILSMNGTVMREMALPKGRITIGRGSKNDIILDDLAISGHHAAIVTTDNDSYLEDLNSTNGTQVNGQPVRKHFLQDEDVIGLARYRIRYIFDFAVKQEIEGKDEGEYTVGRGFAVKILKGPNAGQVIPLIKTFVTIGHSDKQIGMIAKQFDGFYLRNVNGEGGEIKLNGIAIPASGIRLSQKDIIELGEAKMVFL